MARRPARSVLVLGLVLVAFVAWNGGNIALVEADESEEGGPSLVSKAAGEAGKVVRFWESPHNVRFSHGGFGLRSVSQGKDQWQLAVSENGDVSKPGIFVSQEGGHAVAVGMDYDTAKSRYNVAEALGLKLDRVAFTAATKFRETEEDPVDAEWTFHVQGDKARHFSATGDRSGVVYDGSFGVEVPVPQAEGLSVRYAFDAKKRADAENMLPNWLRHNIGLSYQLPQANATLHIQQHNPDHGEGPFEYAAELKGEITGTNIKGSPTYALRAARDGGTAQNYDAVLRLKGPEGLTGGMMAAIHGKKPLVSAWGEYTAKRTVQDGVEVSGDAKFSVNPPHQVGGGNQVVHMHPIGVQATADLATLAPKLADSGSKMDVRLRYRLGADMPSASAAVTLKRKELNDAELVAEASMDDQGRRSGKLSLNGKVGDAAARYEAQKVAFGPVRHAAQVLYPAERKDGQARGFGRIYHNGDKPRVQLGVQYDFNTEMAGKPVRVDGESAIYDSGDTLLGENGLAWRDTRLNRARLSARVLRNRIQGSSMESHTWLHEHDK